MRSVKLGSYNKKSGLHTVVAQPVEKKRKKFDSGSSSSSSESGRSILGGFLVRMFVFALGVLVVLVVFNVVDNRYWQSTGNESLAANWAGVSDYQEACTNILDPQCWTETFRPKLEQQDGFTNALIVGMDTRSNGTESLRNTDTILVVSYHHETNEVMLVSIPRDFYSVNYGSRINAVYALSADNNSDDEFSGLRSEVEAITGLPIHYQAIIRFDAVINGIDELGGLEVCIEDAFTARYPNDDAAINGGSHWLYYDFAEGCQILTGEKVLVYGRFRYVSRGPSSLASDFSRARRQQEVVEALIDKALGQDLKLTERANLYWNLFNTYQESVETDVKFEDILAAVSLLNELPEDQINVVLDPNFGGLNNFIYTDTSSGAYLIKPRDITYQAINNEIKRIWQSPQFYSEEPALLVINSSGGELPPESKIRSLESDIDFAEFFRYRIEAVTADFAGYKVFDFSEGEADYTLNFVLNALELESASDPGLYNLTRSVNGEDILILVGLQE